MEAAPYLCNVLENRGEDSMCRHEAAEALGAPGDAGSIDIMRAMSDDLDEPTWCGRLVILLLIGSNGKPRIRRRLRN
jgi:hypothetical protein